MNCLIAFKTDTQAYVLPVATSHISTLVISQPRFIPLSDSEGLPELSGDATAAGWIDDCQKVDLLSSPLSRQRIYCWWMALSLSERERLFEQSLELRK